MKGDHTMEIIAKCGYRCDICPAYAPNIRSEEDARKAFLRSKGR
jgi:hypothetical protein